MLSRVKVFLLALPFLILNLAVDTHAQNGRLFGSVVYYQGKSYPASGVRVIAVGGYVRSETRTDSYGNFGMVLPSGRYRIVGQGTSPYAQRVEVTGYVRPYTDSFIYPNPLVLEYQRFRSSEDGISSSPSSLGEAKVEEQMGFANVLVTRRMQGKPVAPGEVVVQAYGAYGRFQNRTNENGFVKMTLRAGKWRIVVLPNQGFAEATVKPNETVNVFIEIGPIASNRRE